MTSKVIVNIKDDCRWHWRSTTNFRQHSFTVVAGRSIYNSADRPVPILRASPDLIRSVLLKTFPTPSEARVIPFPEFARSLLAFADYQAHLSARDLAVEPITGLGIAGPVKWVKSLTGSLKLLR